MVSRWQGNCLWAAVLISFASLCHAQSTVTPEDEYKKLIRVSEDIQPLGENPFGEQVSLYNGSLSFEQTDVSLPGNGPLLQLSRSYHLREAKESESIDGAFSDWDIEIPRITTMTANQVNVTGWQINQSNSNARCTLFGPPPTVAPQQGGADWEPTTWWTGYQLIVPGSGSQDLLKRSGENTLSPTMSGMTFPIVTKQNWMVSCGVLTDNETNGGEGFLAIAPDGTKYTFNHLIYRWAPNMNRPIGSDPMSLQSFGMQPMAALDDFLRRRQASMLVTRVEDRFGNFLTYSYDGANLTAITASDGRALNLAYVPGTSRISTATLQSSGAPRTWSYSYGTDVYHILNKVTLPDSTSWTFDMADFLASDMDPAGGTCSTAAQLSTNTWTGSITHPSGLVGSFQVKGVVHGRSYVPRSCNGTGNDTPGSTAVIPRVYYQLTLMQKTFSGAGVPAETWHYSYSPANESWLQDCVGGCVSTIWTDVVNPLGQATRYTFSNRFDATEGQLLSTDFYSGVVGTALLRSEDNDYAVIPPVTETWPWPWPERYGSVLQSRMNRAQVELSAPQTERTISQDGDNYTWQAESFNAYAQVTQTKRSNSVTGQTAMQEQTTYLNDLQHWVLGLPLQTDNLTTGETVSRNVYDLTKVTLKERWRFGQKLMSYTFNSAGQLASFTDGNNHTTSLSNYKRGIPQTIGYPDTRTQSLTVDDFGQITSITDQAGSTTSYSYDAVGRLKQITYPSGDEQAWYPSVFTYDYVTAAERGLGAGHWRRTASKGNARAVTYFDALLRPVLSDNYINGVAGSTTTALTNYDSKGQKTFTSYPSASALNFTTTPATAGIAGSTSSYDALGRLIQARQDSELGVLTTSTAYLSGARQQVTDPKGKVTTTSYQVFDQPSYDAVTKVQAPENVTQVIVRDLYSNPLSIRQSGLYATQSVDVTKTLTYDSHHRLCRTTEPESGSAVMGYDDANNLVWSVSGATLSNDGSCHPELAQSASVTTRSYDAMNRLLTLSPPAGTQGTVYTYDALGNMASATSGLSLWTASRNKRGQLTGESLQVDSQGVWAISYAHDTYGNVALIHYPSGENVSYAPDALGRATQVGSYATGLTYFPDGEVKDFDYGNGAVYAAEKNARQLVSNFSYGQGATPVVSEDYTYDANGNITKVDDLAGGPRSKVFGYDALNRLTSAQATGLWGTESYTYDPLNNLRTRITGAQTFIYNYDASNRLGSISGGAGSTFVYDNRGNVINKNGANLVFDQKNQLTQIPGYGDYAYDAAGRRVMKTPAGGGSPTYYFYSQAGQLMYQYEPVSNRATSFIYLGAKMIARNSLILVIPGIPASITVPGSSSGSYTVSWADTANTSNYVLEQSLNGAAWTSVYAGSGLSQAMHQTANGSYTYRVKACNVVGCSGYRTSAPVVVTLPPTVAPTVSAPTTSSTGTYTVSWTGVAGAATYILQEQINGGSWTTLQNTGATSKAFSGKANGNYGYRAQASNTGGPGPWSSSKVVAVGLIPAAPPAPNVSVSGPEWKPVFAVSWSAMPWATRYEAIMTDAGGVTTIYNGPNTSASILVLDEGSVSFQVRACSTYGCSAWSASTGHGGSAPTGVPTLSVPANSSTGSYTVSWTSVSGATRYTLQEQVNGGSWTSVQNSTATSMAISGKTSGSYGYRVEACNANGCGQWSATRTIAVGVIPATPATPTVSASGPSYKPVVTVRWGAVAGATSYTVEITDPGSSVGDTFYTGPNTSASSLVFATGTVKFRVKACNATGCSGWSGYGSITLQSDLGLMALPAESSSVQEVPGE
jgi:YD repeat-containing protein